MHRQCPPSPSLSLLSPLLHSFLSLVSTLITRLLSPSPDRWVALSARPRFPSPNRCHGPLHSLEQHRNPQDRPTVCSRELIYRIPAPISTLPLDKRAKRMADLPSVHAPLHRILHNCPTVCSSTDLPYPFTHYSTPRQARDTHQVP